MQLSNTLSHLTRQPKTAFLETLHDKRNGVSADQLAAALFCLVVPTAAHWAQSVAHVINYYLSPTQNEARAEIVTSVKEGKNRQAMELIRAALGKCPSHHGRQYILTMRR